ncbi:hypothetical protein [Morganella psychrotolerans]|uniref:hypothetical protein n=1 Tax=Morganella psychrotolerans TaxID=368603 RepID=UPI0039B0D8D4
MKELNQNIDQSDNGITAKVASLTNLQSIITRMGSNSQLMKTWVVTVVTGFIAIKTAIGGLGFFSYLVPMLICFIFSYLDSYYLSQERIFRNVYNSTASILVGGEFNYFDLKDEIEKKSANKDNSIISCYKSNSIIFFYIPLVIMSTIVIVFG